MKKSSAPYVTLSLIALNLLMGLICIRSEEWMRLLGFTPSRASVGTVISSLFVHAHPAHLLWNMGFLWFFGWHVEEVLKPARFLALFFISGIVSVMCHWLLGVGLQPTMQDQALVGASGAISGLVGYFAVRFYRVRVRLFWWQFSRWGFLMPVWIMALLWVAWQGMGAILNAGSEQAASVSYWAHLGGFTCGILAAVVWGAGATGERDYLIAQARESIQQVYPGTALQWLDPLLKGAQPDPEAARLSAEAWELLGDREAAAKQYALSIQLVAQSQWNDFDLAEQCARRLVLLRSVHLVPEEPLQALLQRQIKHSRYDEAASVMEGWISTATSAPNRPSMMLRLADLLSNHLLQPQRADHLLRDLLKQYPDSAEADIARFRLRAKGRQRG